ncbi:MAG: prolipoprotein diacylglyceryl transferase [Pseudomonadota bacterium]
MHPILIQLGSFKISFYGLMLAVAFFVGMNLAERGARKEGLPPKRIEKLSWWIIVSAILGARFLYTFVEHADVYFRNPWQFFAFREGGLSFFGGLFAAIGLSILYCRHHRLPFWKVADIYTPTIALGLAIAKIGCFLAGCCAGRACDLPWAVTFTDPETHSDLLGVPVHPTQLYESLANFLLLFLLLLFRRRQRFAGELFLVFLIVYGAVRSYLETFRESPGHLAGLTTAQFLSIPMVLAAGLWWFLRFQRRANDA